MSCDARGRGAWGMIARGDVAALTRSSLICWENNTPNNKTMDPSPENNRAAWYQGPMKLEIKSCGATHSKGWWLPITPRAPVPLTSCDMKTTGDELVAHWYSDASDKWINYTIKLYWTKITTIPVSLPSTDRLVSQLGIFFSYSKKSFAGSRFCFI